MFLTSATVSTCPKTKWPPSSSPNFKDGSKLTRRPSLQFFKEVLESVSKDLLALGFTEAESYELINKSYELIGVEDRVELVKKSISLASASTK